MSETEKVHLSQEQHKDKTYIYVEDSYASLRLLNMKLKRAKSMGIDIGAHIAVVPSRADFAWNDNSTLSLFECSPLSEGDCLGLIELIREIKHKYDGEVTIVLDVDLSGFHSEIDGIKIAKFVRASFPDIRLKIISANPDHFISNGGPEGENLNILDKMTHSHYDYAEV